MSEIQKKAQPQTYEYTPSLPQRALIFVYKGINKVIPWHRLPTYIGVLNLSAYRYELRQKNLYDVYPSPEDQGTSECPHMKEEQYLRSRHSDGLYNDLTAPKMGCAGMRFGRNVPRKHTTRPTEEELMTPSPRLISQELLKRDKFKPATTLNLLAAAWIQFQVRSSNAPLLAGFADAHLSRFMTGFNTKILPQTSTKCRFQRAIHGQRRCLSRKRRKIFHST